MHLMGMYNIYIYTYISTWPSTAYHIYIDFLASSSLSSLVLRHLGVQSTERFHEKFHARNVCNIWSVGGKHDGGVC